MAMALDDDINVPESTSFALFFTLGMKMNNLLYFQTATAMDLCPFFLCFVFFFRIFFSDIVLPTACRCSNIFSKGDLFPETQRRGDGLRKLYTLQHNTASVMKVDFFYQTLNFVPKFVFFPSEER